LRSEAAFNQLYPAIDKTADAATRAATALSDARSATDAAFTVLQNAVNAQKQVVSAQITATQATIQTLQGVFTLLDQQVRQLYGTVASTSAMQAQQGQALIDSALKSGKIPDQQALQNAIGAITGNLANKVYATQFEADRDRLVLAGQLSMLEGMTGKQLTTAQQQLAAENLQLNALDGILESAQHQIDALRGIDDSV